MKISVIKVIMEAFKLTSIGSLFFYEKMLIIFFETPSDYI